jgi:trimeric autotransporter adhesin
MKNTSLLALCVMVAALSVQAQEIKIIHLDGHADQYNLADIDSITFSQPPTKALAQVSDGAGATNDILRVHGAGGTTLFSAARIDSMSFDSANVMTIHRSGSGASQFDLADVDSLTFASASAYPISIAYSGTSVTVVNPLESIGVAIAVSGADVTVTSTAGLKDITYVLSGTTSDGMFKVYADIGFTMRLNGVQITNANGPAINIQSHKEITVELVTGTTNTLTDGVTYAAPPTGEDQKSAFFSEGQLLFTGTGSLTVNGHGSAANGLGSDDYISVASGTIVVASAVKDGIHTNVGYFQQDGSVQVTSSSDGVDAGDGPVNITGGNLTVLNTVADKGAVKCTNLLQIGGGTLDLTVQGNQSKGLKAANVLLTGGTVTIHTSGGVVLVASGLGYDPSYCTAVKADTLVDVNGCHLTVVASGTAGRGISSDGNINIESGSVNITCSGNGGTYTNSLGVLDAYTADGLRANRNMNLRGGTITLSSSGTGGKGMSGDANLTVGTSTSSPTLQVTTTGTKIAIGSTGEYAEAKTVSFDSTITFNNGTVTVTSADDGIKAKYRINVYGGSITVTNAYECFEAPNLYVYGGTIHANASDDCLNATWSTVSGGTEQNDGSVLVISGGYLYLVAQSGDGVDSNGSLTISGGTVIIDGPATQPNVGIDVNGTFVINGGFVICAQASGMMTETPSTSSLQRSVMANKSSGSYAAGTLYHIENASGQTLVTFAPPHNYSNVLLSTSNLTSGVTYKIYTGGTCTGGTVLDGLYTGGTYSGGTLRNTFVSSGTVQTVSF